MSHAKNIYIELRELHISDADRAAYERHLDEQYAAWRQAEEASYAAWCQQETDDYADWMDEEEWQRRGC